MVANDSMTGAVKNINAPRSNDLKIEYVTLLMIGLKMNRSIADFDRRLMIFVVSS